MRDERGLEKSTTKNEQKKTQKRKGGGTTAHLRRTPGTLPGLLGRIVRQSAVARAGLLNARLVRVSGRFAQVVTGSVGACVRRFALGR